MAIVTAVFVGLATIAGRALYAVSGIWLPLWLVAVILLIVCSLIALATSDRIGARRDAKP